jgi:hypothetical protein
MNLKVVTLASLLLVTSLSTANAQKDTRVAYEMTATSCDKKMLDEVRKNSSPGNNRLASEVIKSVPKDSSIKLNSNDRYICGYTWVSIVIGEKVARIDKTQSRNAYRAFRVITIPIRKQK